jgi:ParB family chromosome partitioning protein
MTINTSSPAQAEISGDRPIPISSIHVGPRLRKLHQGSLAQLTGNISAHGLRTPISVVETAPSDDSSTRYRLLAGNHRLEAYKRLGRETIPARVHVMGDTERQLWEIDENLCRAELTMLERSEHLLKRKELYEQLHPETRQHIAGAVAANAAMGRGDATDNLSVASFSADTAVTTGLTDRSIRREIARASKIDDAVRDRIRDKPEIADNGSELDALASLPPEDQRRAIDLIEAEQCNSVKAAKRSLEHHISAARETGPRSAGFKTAGSAVTVVTIPKSRLDKATTDPGQQEIIQRVYEIVRRMDPPDRVTLISCLDKLGPTRADMLAACLQ